MGDFLADGDSGRVTGDGFGGGVGQGKIGMFDGELSERVLKIKVDP